MPWDELHNLVFESNRLG